MQRAFKEHPAAVVAIALLLVTVAVAAGVGLAGRSGLPTQQKFETANAFESYTKITGTGVKGRTLVVFDKHSGISERDYRYRRVGMDASAGTTPPVDVTNMVSELAYSGAVRAVTVVLPDAEWPALSEHWMTHWDSFPSPIGFERRYFGVPITFTTAGKLGSPIGERSVVFVEGQQQGSYPAELLEKWTSPQSADVVVIQGGTPR